MTYAESRIVLGATVLLVTPLLYLLLFFAFDASIWPHSAYALLAANVVSAAVFAVLWVLLWRGGVIWTSARRRRTWLSAVGAVVPAVLLYAIVTAVSRTEQMGQIAAGGCWLTAWVASTVIIWRETAEERLKRLSIRQKATLPCPKCGHNMTGLHESRCPGCATQFTLDELFASLTATADGLAENC